MNSMIDTLMGLFALGAGVPSAIVGLRRKPPLFGSIFCSRVMLSEIDTTDIKLLWVAGISLVGFIATVLVKFW